MSGDFSTGRSGAGSPTYVAPGGTNDKQSEGPVQAKSDIQGKLAGLRNKLIKVSPFWIGKLVHWMISRSHL